MYLPIDTQQAIISDSVWHGIWQNTNAIRPSSTSVPIGYVRVLQCGHDFPTWRPKSVPAGWPQGSDLLQHIHSSQEDRAMGRGSQVHRDDGKACTWSPVADLEGWAPLPFWPKFNFFLCKTLPPNRYLKIARKRPPPFLKSWIHSLHEDAHLKRRSSSVYLRAEMAIPKIIQNEIEGSGCNISFIVTENMKHTKL